MTCRLYVEYLNTTRIIPLLTNSNSKISCISFCKKGVEYRNNSLKSSSISRSFQLSDFIGIKMTNIGIIGMKNRIHRNIGNLLHPLNIYVMITSDFLEGISRDFLRVIYPSAIIMNVFLELEAAHELLSAYVKCLTSESHHSAVYYAVHLKHSWNCQVYLMSTHWPRVVKNEDRKHSMKKFGTFGTLI